MNKLRIFLADDHAIVRQGLKMVINAQADMELIGEASDGQSAVDLVLKLQPDVVVMDVSMNVVNGYQATLQLKKVLPNLKILALTRHTESSYVQQLLRAGVSAYVLKQSDAAELIRAIHVVVEGGTYLDPGVTTSVVDNLVGRSSKQSIEKAGTLTERETEVLQLIARGYSNKDIATQLEISVKTVEAHKANGILKLDLHTRVDIVRYALLQNWLLDD